MNRYRVRKGWFGKSVLQILREHRDLDKDSKIYTSVFTWVDVDYYEAPAELWSAHQASEKINKLEVESAEYATELEVMKQK